MLLNTLQPVYVFNGHDHEGCYYQHNNTAKSKEYVVTLQCKKRRHRLTLAKKYRYTIRSMMGDYGGNSVVLDIDENSDVRLALICFAQTLLFTPQKLKASFVS